VPAATTQLLKGVIATRVHLTLLGKEQGVFATTCYLSDGIVGAEHKTPAFWPAAIWAFSYHYCCGNYHILADTIARWEKKDVT
jgi:hypothetical protein